MIRLDTKAESILAHGVALSCSGRLRGHVALDGSRILIQSSFRNLFLCFEGRWKFPKAFFAASSYEGPYLDADSEKVVFSSKSSGAKKVKKVLNDVERAEAAFRLFDDYWGRKGKFFEVTIGKSYLDLINSELSHLEIVAERGKGWKMIQRDIYEGSVVEIEKDSSGLVLGGEKPPFDLRIALPTQDFSVIFLFNETVKFLFGRNYTKFQSLKGYRMKGLLANCRYDEMYDLLEV